MFAWLLLAFVLIPVVELALLIELGRYLGTLPTIALIVATGAAGAALARSQGLQIFRRLQQTMAAGVFPGDEIFGGILVLAGGLLLLTPGLLTDLVGFAALIPGTRRLIQHLLKRAVRRRLGRTTVESIHLRTEE